MIETHRKNGVPVRMVDIRTPDEYARMHIPGADNIPVEQLAEQAGSWNTTDMIVCICNKGHERSQNAAEALFALGYTNTCYLEGGTVGWLADKA